MSIDDACGSVSVADVGVEYENRLSAEEHDQVRFELRLQRPTPLHAGSCWTRGRVRAPDPRRHRQLPSRPAGRPLPGRDVRLRVQFRRFLESAATDNRLELTDTETSHIGSTSGYLYRVRAAAVLSRVLCCLCIVDQTDDAVLDCSLWLSVALISLFLV